MEREKYYRAVMVAAGVFMLLMAFFLWKVGNEQEAELERRLQGEYEIRMEGITLSSADVQHILERKREEERSNAGGEAGIQSFTAWTQVNGAKAKLPDRKQEIQTTAILIAGDNTPRFTLNSEKGCAISKGLAHQLWGTADVVGESLVLDGNRYMVERVEPDEREWVMARTDLTFKIGKDSGEKKPSDIAFDVLTVATEDTGLGNSLKTFLSKYDIESNLTIRQADLLDGIHTLRALPYWTLAFVFAIAAGIKGRRRWKMKAFRGALLYFAAAVGILILCQIAAGPLFTLPEAFIPTRWSDFSFWERTMDTLRMQWDYFTTMQVYLPDQELRRTALHLFIESFASAGLLLAGCRLTARFFI